MTRPWSNDSLVTGTESGTGTRVYPVIIVQSILNFAVNSQIPEEPKRCLVDLFGCPWIERHFSFVESCRTSLAGFNRTPMGTCGRRFIFNWLLVRIESWICCVWGVSCLEFLFLGLATGTTRPCKTTRWLFEQRWTHTAHVVSISTHCAVDRVIAYALLA